MLLKLVTPSTGLPVTLDEAKAFLRVEHSSEDALISKFIRAASIACEGLARISFLRKTWEATYTLPKPQVSGPGSGFDFGDRFPRTDIAAFGLGGVFSKGLVSDPDGINEAVVLPNGPVVAITSLGVLTNDNVSTAIDSTHYTLNGNSLVWGDSFRELIGDNTSAVIRYTAGFADATELDAKASDIGVAILMTVAVIYEHRGLSNVSVPPAARTLLNSYWSSPTFPV